MKTNRQLKTDILEALRCEASLKDTKIAAKASGGVVTLSGTVGSYIKKSRIVDAVKKVTGVKALVEKIEVHFDTDDEKTDPEIAVAVLGALKANKDIPFDRVQIEVEDGHVTLDGEMGWNYQKEAAQQSASTIEGIKVLSNHIEIKNDSLGDI